MDSQKNDFQEKTLPSHIQDMNSNGHIRSRRQEPMELSLDPSHIQEMNSNEHIRSRRQEPVELSLDPSNDLINQLLDGPINQLLDGHIRSRRQEPVELSLDPSNGPINQLLDGPNGSGDDLIEN
jgi:hypothetical protein